MFELTLTPAAPGSRDVASTLYRQLRAAILDGRLREGARLPSTRSAPAAFGVSRNTTQDVYDRLAHEGLAEARHGSGTYVARAHRTPASVGPAGLVRTTADGAWDDPELTRWMGFWRQDPTVELTGAAEIDLRPALVDATLFSHATFRQGMARELRRSERARPSSGSPHGNQGSYRLQAATAAHIGLTRAMAVDASDLLVTSGAQQAFDLIARVMVRPGETVVAVEDPGYPPMRVPFAAAGARIVPVRVDEQGIVVEEIPEEAAIVCVCPSHQFPLGMSLSPARRRALLRFARRTGAIVVEDDYDGEFRHGGSPLEALKSDRESRDAVFYVGSFSKCMFPSLRLGFLVAPQWAMRALVCVKNMTD